VAAKLRAAVTELAAGEYREAGAILSEVERHDVDSAIEVVNIMLRKLQRLRQIQAAEVEMVDAQ
jgi:hypothetical protein